jgi:hypothetical protein
VHDPSSFAQPPRGNQGTTSSRKRCPEKADRSMENRNKENFDCALCIIIAEIISCLAIIGYVVYLFFHDPMPKA